MTDTNAHSSQGNGPAAAAGAATTSEREQAASPDPARTPGRNVTTLSGIPVKPVYLPSDAASAA